MKRLQRNLACLLLILSFHASLHAANGTWTNLSGGSWANTANWDAGAVANGIDSLADFSTLDLTATATVTLDGNQTIGTLTTGDTGGTGNTNWIFNPGTGGTLTFAVSSGTPVINVTSANLGNVANPSTLMNAELAGSAGLEKQGSGMLLLGNSSNSISGVLNIAAGIVGLTTNSYSLPNITGVTVADGGQLMLGDLTAAGITASFGKPITIAGQGPNFGALLIRGNSATGIVTNLITLAASARIGTYGVTATSRFQGGLTGTGDLTLHAQAGAATHVVRSEIRSPFTHDGQTILKSLSAAHTVAIYGANYLPTTTILRLEPGNTTGFTEFALNGFDQTLAGLSSTGTGTRRVINNSPTLATLTVNDAGNRTYSGTLGGTSADDNNFKVVKQGTGSWQNGGTASFTGGLHVQGGQISFGSGVNTFSGGILIDSGASLRINGGGAVGNNAITNNGELLLDYTVSKTLNNPISGTGGVTVKGGAAGIAILNATNTYSGPTICNGLTGGRLNLFTSKALGGGDLSVGDAFTNGITVDVAGQSLTNANLTFGAFLGATLEVNLGTQGNPSVPVFQVPGALTLNGTTSLILTGNGFAAGTFTLIKYGSLVGSLAGFNPTVVAPAGLGATLIDTGSSIDVVLVSLAEEIWNGNLNSSWDTTTFNWTNRIVGMATNYSGTTPVRFDDRAAGTTSVDITLPVTPQLTTVSNATKDYSFNNAGGYLSGTAGLNKQGAAKLTLSTPNDYSGNTTIQAGSLVLGAPEVIPDGASKGNTYLGGKLDLNGFDETVNNLAGSGSVTNSAVGVSTFTINASISTNYDGVISGAVNFNKTGANNLTLTAGQTYTGSTTIKGGNLIPANALGQCLPGDVLLDGTATARLIFGSSNQLADTALVTFSSSGTALRFVLGGFSDTIGGIQDLSSSGNRIVEAASDNVTNAPATLTLNVAAGQTYTHGSFFRDAAGATNSALSLIKTGAGTQAFSAGAAFVSYSGPTIVSNGTLEFSGAGSVANNSVITLQGGFVKFSGGGTRTNAITGGAGGLIEDGTNTLTLLGANTYTGTTTVSNGTLLVRGSLAAGSAVTAWTGGTLGGDGAINGPVVLNDGAILAPGANGVGTLTLANTLSLSAASETVIELNRTANTSDAVTGLSTVSFNGTLTVTNLDGTFTGGETYHLFNSGGYTGNFSVTNLPALDPGLTWNWNPANGTLAVSGGIASTPTNISYTISSGTLTLTWPGSHLGWYAQSNSVNLTDTDFWFDVANSQLATNLVIPVNSTQPKVFYRLRKP